MNYLCKNMESSIKKKIYVYNTKNRLINNYVFSEESNNNENKFQKILTENNKITDYLKKHSNINKQFIDDFYSCFGDGYNEKDMVINIDLIAKWLEARKDHLKRLLMSSFRENIDYIEKKIGGFTKGRGSNNIKTIMLTHECAKLLFMISKNDKSCIIRKYYIDLDKLLLTKIIKID